MLGSATRERRRAGRLSVDKADWIAQFVTELVFRSTPPVPSKFSHLVAAHAQRWLTHADKDPCEIAQVWFASRQLPGASPPKR